MHWAGQIYLTLLNRDKLELIRILLYYACGETLQALALAQFSGLQAASIIVVVRPCRLLRYRGSQ